MVFAHIADFSALHHGVVAVDITYYARVQKRMVKCRVEDGLLFLRPAFYPYFGKIIFPKIPGFRPDVIEVEGSALFGIEIHSGVLAADERHSDLEGNLFTFFDFPERKPISDVITGHFLFVGGVGFVFPGIGVPLGFRSHRPLLFVESTFFRGLRYP